MAALTLDSAGPKHDVPSDVHGKGLKLQLGVGVELLVSMRGQSEQGARFWGSVEEVQAMLLSPIFSQHPAPLLMDLSMPFIGKPPKLQRINSLSLHPLGHPNPRAFLDGCWCIPSRCCTLGAPSTFGAVAAGPEEIATSLLLPEARTLLLVNNKSEVLPWPCSVISRQGGDHGFLMRLQLICPMLKAVVN